MTQVKLFMSTHCPYCSMAKSWLTSKNVAFTEVDVNKDRQSAKIIFDKTDQKGVPIITIDDTLIIGFDQPLLEKELKKKHLL